MAKRKNEKEREKARNAVIMRDKFQTRCMLLFEYFVTGVFNTYMLVERGNAIVRGVRALKKTGVRKSDAENS
jgi:hypothetical protein